MLISSYGRAVSSAKVAAKTAAVFRAVRPPGRVAPGMLTPST
jgi:hypothetical protein